MRYQYQVQGKVYEVEIERQKGSYRVKIDGLPYEFEILNDQPGEISLRFEGKPVRLFWAAAPGRNEVEKWISTGGCTYRIEKPSTRSGRVSTEEGSENRIRAPMPAEVRSVLVSEGEPIKKGQTLILLEAMKMEIRLTAPHDGYLRRLMVQEDHAVERGQVLIEIEPISD